MPRKKANVTVAGNEPEAVEPEATEIDAVEIVAPEAETVATGSTETEAEYWAANHNEAEALEYAKANARE